MIKLLHLFIQWLLSIGYFPGKNFIITHLPRFVIPRPKESAVISTNFGFKIKINPAFDKEIEQNIYYTGTYEHGTLHIIDHLLSPGDNFVDVGANIGFITLFAAAKVGEKGKIYAFEPVADTFTILKENIAINKMNNVIPFPFALGAAHSEETIYSKKNNRGGASLIAENGLFQENIQIKKLDDIPEIMAAANIKIIKIDVEGWEAEVLKGGRKLINSFSPVLIIEFSKLINYKRSDELYDIICSFNNYQIFKLKSGKVRVSSLVPVERKEDLPEHDNLFCFPAGFIKLFPEIFI